MGVVSGADDAGVVGWVSTEVMVVLISTVVLVISVVARVGVSG